MPNTILSLNHDDQQLYFTISSFFRTFKISDLLHKCGAQKPTGADLRPCCLKK